MALTGRIVASIYRINQYDLKNSSGAPASAGKSESLPSAMCLFYPIPGTATITAAGVTMASIIELLPTGLNQKPTLFYTPSTVAELQTNGN